MMFGLPPDVIRRLQEVLVAHQKVEKAILYGSRAKGNYRNGSDIDLTFTGDLDSNDIHSISRQIDNLNLPYLFDLSTYDELSNPELLEHIERVGKVFYGRDLGGGANRWRSIPLKECIQHVAIPAKIPRKQFKDSGRYPIVSQEISLINGYCCDESAVISVESPIVVFGDHTRVIKHIDFDFVVGAGGVKLLQPKNFLNAKYFYYFLMAHPCTELGYARHYRLLKELDIRFPIPISEQKQIVAILDQAFTAIATATANTKKNLANARGLLESELNRVFQNPGGGAMAGWKMSRLGDMCHIAKEKHKGGSLPFLGMEHVESGTGKLVSELVPCETKSSTFYFNGTHLLYGRLRPYLNKVFLPDFEGHCSTEIFPIECSSKLNRHFLFYWLTTATTVAAINRTSTGARMPRANVNALLDFDFFLPTLSEQKRIASFLDKLSTEKQSLVDRYEQKLTTLTELKQSFLHKAFTGELTANPKAPDRILSSAGA